MARVKMKCLKPSCKTASYYKGYCRKCCERLNIEIPADHHPTRRKRLPEVESMLGKLVETEVRYEFGPKSKFYYTSRWKKFRESVLAKYGRICVRCDALDRVRPAVVADHIIPAKKMTEQEFFNLENMQPLCKECDQIKRNYEMKNQFYDYRNVKCPEQKEVVENQPQ